MPPDIVMLDAVALSRAIQTRQVSCVEVMGAYLDQIDRLNPRVNAIVALRDRAALLHEARARDDELARGTVRGWMHGFPQAIKDLEPTRGIVSTSGSPIFKDHVPSADSIMVARLRASGAIIIGKTNVPEFGLGSQTYNSVYGTTLNAYDPSLTAGGSSGGAAVGLALCMLPVADGSDYGGSLRNPAAFNTVFGFRTCCGRVPVESRDAFLPSMGVLGPMARTVPDLAMLLSIQAGCDDRAPLSIEQDPAAFTQSLARDMRGVRIAWGGDLRGALPFEPGVLDVCGEALLAFEAIGCTVEDALPDHPIEQLWQDFLTLRAWQIGSRLVEYYRDPVLRALMKPEAIEEVERGLALTAFDVSAASIGRTAWYHAMLRLFERYDYLVLPGSQVFPFAADLHWPREIAGRAMDGYARWMQVMTPGTMSGCPVLSVPAGFDAQGRPMGLQIIGRNHAEFACLQLGFAYDQATGWVARHPPALLRAA